MIWYRTFQRGQNEQRHGSEKPGYVYAAAGRSWGRGLSCWKGFKAREVGGGQKRARGSREKVLFKL